MTSERLSLSDLGWSAFFQGQLSLDEIGAHHPFRLISVARNRATGLGPDGPVTLSYPPDLLSGDTAVGDWVLADPETHRIVRVLDRQGELGRRAAGPENRRQLIAANVDTLFIVTSCNADFNVARIERYLALALDAGCVPVVVLTKADLAEDPDDFMDRTRAISPRIADVIALNAKDPESFAPLMPWLTRGQTVAFLGSSGVGKSTLIAGLTGAEIATQGIREDDAKGRHTTTSRAMLRTASGAMVIDMPGMREIAMHDMAEGIDDLFDDIVTLTAECRFRDCAHDTEPGCAVQAAVADGRIDPDRLARWQKLRREDALNTETVHERRARERDFGRVVRDAVEWKGRGKG